MEKVRLKNIGVTAEVWRELKIMTIDQGCTMDDVVAQLLRIAREQQKNAEPGAGKREDPKGA